MGQDPGHRAPGDPRGHGRRTLPPGDRAGRVGRAASMSIDRPQEADARETARIEAFSDGVFAVAATLLVLDLKVPHDAAGGQGLVRALAGEWPAYLAFVTSFAFIGIMWINHHRLFTLIRRSDNLLLVFNGLLLLGVTFVPFATAV